jgi:hypothetical protein
MISTVIVRRSRGSTSIEESEIPNPDEGNSPDFAAKVRTNGQWLMFLIYRHSLKYCSVMA